jgi:hypothetical protein
MSVLAACLHGAAIGQGAGLQLDEADVHWPRWQARMALLAGPPADHGGSLSWAAQPLGGARMVGDYYLTGPGFGQGRVAGGLRATSGVYFGTRGAALVPSSLAALQPLSVQWWRAPHDTAAPGDGVDSAEPLPYVGIGYTGISPSGGWGFSADFGLIGTGASGGLRPSRAMLGSHRLDDLLAGWRLAPVLQLGVSYRF